MTTWRTESDLQSRSVTKHGEILNLKKQQWCFYIIVYIINYIIIIIWQIFYYLLHSRGSYKTVAQSMVMTEGGSCTVGWGSDWWSGAGIWQSLALNLEVFSALILNYNGVFSPQSSWKLVSNFLSCVIVAISGL